MLSFTIDDPPATAPHRPAVRAGVARAFNAYAVATRFGLVTVQAWPHRGMAHARQIARRLHRDAAGYLWAIRASDMPGVVVTAPTTDNTATDGARVVAVAAA